MTIYGHSGTYCARTPITPLLTITIDVQIADEDKGHPARWLAQLLQHYLPEEPIIQSTHNFLCLLKQEHGMRIKAWHTLVRLEYQKEPGVR